MSKLTELVKHTDNLQDAFLIGISYEPELKKALLVFYKDDRLYYHIDQTGHKPYCLIDEPTDDIPGYIKGLVGYVGSERIDKYDILNEVVVSKTKVIVDDPLLIAGTSMSVADHRDHTKSWESHIPYTNNYIYDNQLKMSTFYSVTPTGVHPNYGKLVEGKDLIEYMQIAMPSIKRCAIDIEVLNPLPDSIPDASDANLPVICVGLRHDGIKETYALNRKKEQVDLEDVKVFLFESEYEMLIAVSNRLMDFPVSVTFNGHSFDFKYLHNRILNFGSNSLFRETKYGVFMKYGIHLDLYPWFCNPAIETYVYEGKYKFHGLDDIAKSLIDKGKTEIDKSMMNMPLQEICAYNMNDVDLTYELTSYNNDFTIRMIVLISRLMLTPIETITSSRITVWIKNHMQWILRSRNTLIPNKGDIAEYIQYEPRVFNEKTGTMYKGAKVLEPTPGVHFDVTVVDYASLYPGIIKVHNISFETVRCRHEECKRYSIPGTPHWECHKRKGLFSEIIGNMRDLRLNYFKPRGKTDPFFKAIEQALKVIMNASYGFLGFLKSDFLNIAAADSVTALGRSKISLAIKKAENKTIEVIAGDTDSCFLKRVSKDQLDDLTKEVYNEVEIELEVAKHYRFLAVEKLKKNYLGVDDKGRPDIKGFVGKKRHTPQFIKKYFSRMISEICKIEKPSDVDSVINNAVLIAKQGYTDIINRNIEIKDMIFTVVSNKKYKDYKKQSMILRLGARIKRKDIPVGYIFRFVKTYGKDSDAYRLYKECNKDTISIINIGKYADFYKTVFEQILSPFGIDVEEHLVSSCAVI